MVPFQHQLKYSGHRSDQSYYFTTSGCHIFTLCNSSDIYIYIFFTLFCFYQHSSRLHSHGPKETQSLIHICSLPPPTVQNCEVFIYIPVTKLKKILRGPYLQKRAQIKEQRNSCEDDGLFCLFFVGFFLTSSFFPPNYILSVDNFAQFEVGCRKLPRTGGEGG